MNDNVGSKEILWVFLRWEIKVCAKGNNPVERKSLSMQEREGRIAGAGKRMESATQVEESLIEEERQFVQPLVGKAQRCRWRYADGCVGACGRSGLILLFF